MMAPAVMTTTAAVVLYSTTPNVYAKEQRQGTVDLSKVRDDIRNVIETDMDKRGDGTSLAGTLIRLAWHCAGTYSKEDGTGGSNGARMRFDPEASWGANAGLKVARDALEPIKAKYPGISYADLYTYAGVVAVEEAGGPKIPFRLGRTDMDSGESSVSVFPESVFLCFILSLCR